MPDIYNEDLFEGSKMSFGEHLEELRICLVRALIGLAIGFLFGLLVASDVVKHIEGPLDDALQKFYREKTEAELRAKYPQLNGQVIRFMQNKGFVFEEIYCEVDELARLAAVIETESNQPLTPPSADKAQLTTTQPMSVVSEPGPPTAKLVKTRFWKPLDKNVTSLTPTNRS